PPKRRATPSGPAAVLAELRDLSRKVLHNVVVPAGKAGTISLGALAIVLLFLLVQNRIDRQDPKLARAPVKRPADLEFVDRSEIGQ
ncbi:MAG TPA: hypothetical protein VJT31_10055, partial [Rugosimonospora sp.]|nr:hypothetical protein [Rugosimonospora sp.]